MKLKSNLSMDGWGGDGEVEKKNHPSTRIATFPRIFPGAVLKLDFNGAHPVLILDLPRLRAAVPGALISPFICHLEAPRRVCVCQTPAVTPPNGG